MSDEHLNLGMPARSEIASWRSFEMKPERVEIDPKTARKIRKDLGLAQPQLNLERSVRN
jgi:hypothetical protein